MAGKSETLGEETGEAVRETAKKTSPWIGRVAQLGYVAKGSVYAIIGFLALREALGAGGQTIDPAGAMRSVGAAGSEAFGGILLVLLALGLLCYALWKLVQGVTDADGKGSDAHGLLRRVGYVGSAAIHGVFAYTAAQSVFGAEDTSEDAMTASAMAYGPTFGRVLIALVGLIVVGVGLYQLYAAYTAKFRGELKLRQMGDAEERFVTLAGRVGTAARALAIGVAGAFVLLAAYQSDPSEVRGLGAALETLQRQPLGSYMLATIAAGLILYGAFMFAIARYRRIDPAAPPGAPR